MSIHYTEYFPKHVSLLEAHDFAEHVCEQLVLRGYLVPKQEKFLENEDGVKSGYFAATRESGYWMYRDDLDDYPDYGQGTVFSVAIGRTYHIHIVEGHVYRFTCPHCQQTEDLDNVQGWRDALLAWGKHQPNDCVECPHCHARIMVEQAILSGGLVLGNLSFWEHEDEVFGFRGDFDRDLMNLLGKADPRGSNIVTVSGCI